MTLSVHVVPGSSPGFTEAQVKILDVRGLSLEAATAAGVVPVQTDEQLRAIWPEAPD